MFFTPTTKYQNQKSEKITFAVATRKIKYLGINLTKEVKDLHSENYATLKIPPFVPAISLLGLYPKNPETPIQKNLCTPMFTAALFTAKCWKQSKCPSVNEWIKKL